MDWCLAPQRRAGELAATIRNYLIYVHVELCAAACHPYVQGEHVVVPAAKDLVANLYYQPVTLIIKPLSGVVRVGCRFLQCRVGGDHFPRDQVLTDTEVLKGALCLSTPEF